MTGSVTGIRRRRTVAGRRETSHLPPDRAFYGQTLIRNQLINVGGKKETFEFRNVESTKHAYSYSFRGSLAVGFDNKGNVISSWIPNDRPALVKKTNNTKFIVASFDKNNGTVLGEIGVFVTDFNDEADEYLEYGLFFKVEIKDGVLDIRWDDSRVVIHE